MILDSEAPLQTIQNQNQGGGQRISIFNTLPRGIYNLRHCGESEANSNSCPFFWCSILNATAYCIHSPGTFTLYIKKLNFLQDMESILLAQILYGLRIGFMIGCQIIEHMKRERSRGEENTSIDVLGQRIIPHSHLYKKVFPHYIVSTVPMSLNQGQRVKSKYSILISLS